MSAGHARLGPSNHRWPHCPGSIREEAAYPDIAGTAAIDGTGSHELLEQCLKNGVRAELYDGQIVGANHPDNPMGWLISPDRIERVQECLDYVSRRYAELSKEYPSPVHAITIHTESKSDPGAQIGRDDWWGTVDITIEVENVSGDIIYLEVIDYKDGRGWVDVKSNTQLISYLIGKMNIEEGLFLCRATIVQPKTNPSVRYDDISAGAMRYHIKTLTAAAVLTDNPDAPLVSGDHCTWCKHGRAKNCTAKSEQSLERINNMENTEAVSGSLFEVIEQTFGDITAMPSEKLEELADAKAGLMEVFERVDTELQRRVEDPDDNTVTGYAMLPGRASYEWVWDDEKTDEENEKVIADMLKGRRLKKSDIYPAKLITVGAMKKLDILTNDQKKKIADKFVKKVDGKKTLKQVRQSAEPTDAVAMFSDVAPVSFL